MVENALDFSVILEKCGARKEAAPIVLSNIQREEEFLDDIVGFYEYLLANVKEPDLLSGIIKLADSHKNQKILSRLLD